MTFIKTMWEQIKLNLKRYYVALYVLDKFTYRFCFDNRKSSVANFHILIFKNTSSNKISEIQKSVYVFNLIMLTNYAFLRS